MSDGWLSGQSAIEYLMTYGWMLLVVAVTGGAVFATVGDQGVESSSGFDGDVQIDNFGASDKDELGLEIRDGSGQGITVSKVNVSDPDTGQWIYKEFTGEKGVDIGSSKIFELPNVTKADSSNELEVEVIYDSEGLSNLSEEGKINAQLELNNTGSFEGLPEDDHQIINDETGDSGLLSAPGVGGEWSRVEPAGAEGGYSYFFDSSTDPYGVTYGGNSSVQYDGDGFFVMKYQASNDGSNVPVSDGSAGWNSISFNDDSSQSGPSAYTACENLDSQTSSFDVHLMTNREWMTVARQIAQNPNNWANGVVGSTGSTGGLYQGNRIGGSYDRAVDLGGYPKSSSDGGEVQRSLELPMGDVVWDISGDLRQWVDVDENGTNMNGDSGSKIYERAPMNSSVVGGAGLGDNNGFTIDNSMAALRGGYYSDGGQAGVFYSRSGTPSVGLSFRGFRCAAVPIS